MFGSVMLDVAIGLILVYLILSLVCTAMREVVELFRKDRATFLHEGICELLHDTDLAEDLYQHPLISSLYRDTYPNAQDAKGLPSYIPSRSFALAVLDMAARGRDTTQPLSAGAGSSVLSVATIRQNISLMQNAKVQRVLLSALDTADGDITKVQAAIETWFNASMDRVSGWYKKRSQWILICFGIGLAAVANIDTIRLAVSFYKDPSKRQAAVAMAGSMVKTPPAGAVPGGPQPTAADAAAVLADLDSLSLPIGWHGAKSDFGAMTILGWLFTGLAISLGAPFWFDLLGKVMTIRSSMKPGSKASSDKPADQPSGGSTNVTVVAPSPPAPAAAPAAAAVASGAIVHPGDDYRPHEWASGHAQAGAI